MHFFSFIELILSRWVTFLVITISVTLAAAVLSFLLLVVFPTYETTIMLLITPDPAEAIFAKESGPHDLSDPIRTMLCTYTEILLSWNVCGRVVDKLLTDGMPSVSKNRYKLWYESHITPVAKRMVELWFILNSGEFKGWPTRKEALIAGLKQGMTVDLTDNTYFITINFEGDHPRKVYLVADAFSEVFSEFIYKQTDKEIAFVISRLEEEIELESRQLLIAENLLAAFQKSQDIVNLDHQTVLILGRLEDVQTSILETEYEMEELQGELSGIEFEMNDLGDMYTKIRGSEISPRIAEGLSHLASLERELVRAELESDDNNTFDRLSIIKQQIKQVREQIRKELFEKFSVQLATKFPSYIELSKRLADSRTGVFALDAKQKELYVVKTSIEDELAEVPDINRRFMELSRRITDSEAKLHVFNISKTDAQLSRLISHSNISMIDSPKVPKYPASPRMLLFTVVGFFIGLMAAGGFLLIQEFLRGKINTAEECVEILERPLLATVLLRN